MNTGLVLLPLLGGAAAIFFYLTLRGSGRGRTNHPATTPEQANVVLFEEQSRELDQLHARGDISQSERDALLLEAQRKLLSDTDTDHAQKAGGQTRPSNGAWLLLVAMVLSLALSLVLYRYLGAAPDLRIASLLQEGWGEGQAGLDNSVKLRAALVERIAAKPDNYYHWVILARLERENGDLRATAKAYRGALKLAPDNADTHAELAQVLFALAGDRVEPEVEAHVRRALALDPANPSALGLAGIAAFNRGDYRVAIQYWQGASRALPPDSSSLRALQAGINSAKAELGEGVDSAAKWSIRVTVSLAPPLVAPADATVFVYLREWNGPPMPLAAQRLRVADLPTSLRFDDSLALAPERPPSGVAQFEVVARIALGGGVSAGSGDLEGRLGPIDRAGPEAAFEVVINQRLP